MKQPTFARVLAVAVPKGPVFAQAVLPKSLVSEVFGPGEVDSDLLFWNFADTTGKVRASICCKTSEPEDHAEMKFISRAGDGTFFEWATERINLTHNGDLPPAFLGTRNMALSVQRL